MAPQQTKTQEVYNNMNYILRRNRRKIRGYFETYEEARSYARRAIRAKHREDVSSWPSRNPPSITEYGYEIVRVGS